MTPFTSPSASLPPSEINPLTHYCGHCDIVLRALRGDENLEPHTCDNEAGDFWWDCDA